MTDPKVALAGDFESPTESDWRALVGTALKGADFEKRLVKTTFDGLRIEPLYTEGPPPEPCPPRAPRLGDMPWDIRAAHAYPDPAKANKDILADLEGGVSSITLKIDPTGEVGIAVNSRDDLERLLEGVLLGLAPLSLEAGPHGLNIGSLVLDLLAEQSQPPAGIQLNLDPIGEWARAGTCPENHQTLVSEISNLAQRGVALGPIKSLCADERWVHEAGGTNVQGLGAVMATATAYLRDLTSGGLALEDAANQISFTLVADANLYETVAKLRAARHLWARVVEASGGDPEKCPACINVETASRMMSARDPWGNLLRTSVAAFAASLGGADAITVLPFTHALGHPSTLARRLARNSQIILAEESNLGRVADPTAGAWAFDTLTDQTATLAWEKFQEIEALGGIKRALTSNHLHDWVMEAKAARDEKVATRKEPLTGVSEFAHLAELPVKTQPCDYVASKNSDPQSGATSLTFNAFEPYRVAQTFEAFRSKSDAYKKQTGTRPQIFLCAIGTPADYAGRASFAKNFFEAIGIEALAPTECASAEEAAKAWAASGARLAVLCSSDTYYASDAVPFAQCLKAAGLSYLYLAGNPGKHRDVSVGAGIDDFIFVGENLLDHAAKIYTALGETS